MNTAESSIVWTSSLNILRRGKWLKRATYHERFWRQGGLEKIKYVIRYLWIGLSVLFSGGRRLASIFFKYLFASLLFWDLSKTSIKTCNYNYLLFGIFFGFFYHFHFKSTFSPSITVSYETFIFLFTQAKK